VTAAQNNLGRVLQQAGRYAAAEPHLSRAWELARELFGTDEPRYVVATGNLGDLQRRLGHFDRAEELLVENLELRRSILGPDHRATGNAMGLLAALRLDQDRPADALRLCDDALALFGRIGYENPQSLTVTMTRRARALAALGRGDEAEAAFAEALAIGEKAGSDAGAVWPDLLVAYARFLVARGDPAAAEAAKRALEGHREILGASHPSTRSMQALAEQLGVEPIEVDQPVRASK
jgi:tetratricopeptide (TPR) repeat protein